jgi:phosphatidylserine synthase
MAGLGIALLVGINAGVFGRASIGAGATPSLVVVTMLLGLLMVSNVPFRTFKDLRPTRRVRVFVATVLALQLLVSIQVDYMVALAMGLAGYLTFNAAGNLVSLGRHVRLRAHRDGTLIEEINEDEIEL